MNRKENVASKFVKKSFQESVDALTKQIRRFEKRIVALVQSDDEWKRQKAEIVQKPRRGLDRARVRNPDRRGPRVGEAESTKKSPHWSDLAPFNRDSGEFRGRRAIRGGRSSVRCSLYMATLSRTTLQPSHQSLRIALKALGKKPKVIITACMRKLLVILNTMVKNNTHWNPAISTT